MNFDLLGAMVSATSTLLFIRINAMAWPVGLLATVINGMLYWNSGIYAEMVLELVYAVSMFYGWYLWFLKKNSVNPKAIRAAFRTKHLSQALFYVAGLFLVIYYTLSRHTPSTVPFMDAMTTSLSLLAQWLMCHKIIWTWVVWLVTDAIYAFMYWNKQLPYHVALMLVYSGMAVGGFVYWYKQGAMPPMANTNQCAEV